MKHFFLTLCATLGLTAACTARENIKSVNTDVFGKLITEDTTAVVLDVRTAEEFAAGHINSALNIDYLQEEKFKNSIKALDKERTYYVYCRSGRRSYNAAVLMQGIGLRVVNLNGGFIAWESAGMTSTDKNR
ncbi:MAG: rhodanese-like domain-containing protein [Bacteroidaceae bacterium]|nr:rhodanese-like domain-containing protein [Prevotellaceae bacterium]MDY5632251.1 rhodanese-like domain-containing protein [Bacteroidaceae bacterium]